MTGKVVLSGILVDALNAPLVGAKVVLKSVKTGDVIYGVSGSFVTGSDGSYSITVPVGSFKCYIIVEEDEIALPGYVNVYEYSGSGTLNEYLYAPCQQDGAPMFIVQWEMMRQWINKKVESVEDDLRSTIIPLGKQYSTIADAIADIENIPDGSFIYVRSTDGTTIANEYTNSSGVLNPTGRAIPSTSSMITGYVPVDVKGDAEITEGVVVYDDGTTLNTSSWDAYFIKVLKGEIVTYSGIVGSQKVDEQMAYLIQFDENKIFVEPLAYWVSTGRDNDSASISATANEDGYIYVRVKVGVSFEISQSKKSIITRNDVDVDGGVASYKTASDIINNSPLVDVTYSDSTGYVNGRVIYADGTETDLAGDTWKAAYVRVNKGDKIEYHGVIGSGTVGENIAYLIQLDSSQNFVDVISSSESDGATKESVIYGVATQDGFVYVRVRVVEGVSPKIYKSSERFVKSESVFNVSNDYDKKSKSLITLDVTNDSDTSYIKGRVISTNGVVSDVAGSSWAAAYVPVKKGDVINYDGLVGSFTRNEVIAQLIQMDYSLNVVSPISLYTSPGSISHSKITGVATQDGFVYVRVRVDSDTVAKITKTSDINESPFNVFSSEYINSVKLRNMASVDVLSDKNTYILTGRVLYADGTYTDSAGKNWNAVYFPVKKGDVIKYDGQIGSGTLNQVIAYIIQLDSSMQFVAPIATYNSPGSSSLGTMIGVATQDGFVYVRVRLSDPLARVTKLSQVMASNDYIYGDLINNDVTLVSDYIKDNSVMYSGGRVVSGSSYSTWKMYYIPVKKGDIVEMYGAYGSATVGEKIGYIMQCDLDKNWISDLFVFTSGGGTVTARNRGVATVDGFVAVRVRKTTDPVYSVSKIHNNSFARVDQVSDMIASSIHNLNKKAKVFNAPFHNDLSSCRELNPNFDSFTSPLNYTFKKQWARRDFYNSADSYMLSFMDLTTNPWNSQSNIFDIASGNVFSYLWDNGVVKFTNPSTNGKVIMFADRYLPFATTELAIDSVRGNAFIGVMFSDATQSNYVSVRVNGESCIIEIYTNGAIAATKSFSISNIDGSVLRIQNTGVSLIITQIFHDNSWSWIGRYDHYSIFDARLVEFISTWKTYVFAQTENFTVNDFASFSGFSNRLSSGSNSVSIRFLTYEDGTFIQKGNWMYFLVEGTGTTISDLYTQIVRINFNSGEVQMIGAIFQVRTDGTDEGIVLGDDSIKAVYDRNSETWKGVSCGMDYQGKGLADNNRPKLYFETKQDLLQGGIIIVKNSIQMKNSNGSYFGIGSSYVEDIDFFYDKENHEWVLTGNSISSGCKTFRSPTLYDSISQEFSTAEVPVGVRDTGNQFVRFGNRTFLTSGGTINKLHLREYSEGLPYLGELSQDVYLPPSTQGPWCTLVPYSNGDETSLYLLSFDRSDLYEGFSGASTYDHGGLYCWKV